MNLSQAFQAVGSEVVPTSAVALVLLGGLYLFYEWLLPKPYTGIPHDKKAARKLLGDGPEMIREVGLTREVHIWLLKKVNEIQEPLCQVLNVYPNPFGLVKYMQANGSRYSFSLSLSHGLFSPTRSRRRIS